MLELDDRHRTGIKVFSFTSEKPCSLFGIFVAGLIRREISRNASVMATIRRWRAEGDDLCRSRYRPMSAPSGNHGENRTEIISEQTGEVPLLSV